MGVFKPATRFKSKLRLALDGPSGSGKTFTALRFATALGKKIAVINSESGAIQKYLGLAPDNVPWQFDVCDLSDFSPSTYTQMIMAAGAEGYEVLIIDSLSHAWLAALEMVDKMTEASRSKNAFTSGWRNVTPQHNRLVESILHSPCHIIGTMRAKTEYVMESNERGVSTPRKIGMEAVQRQGLEYEFDIVARMDIDHVLRVSKSRCPHPQVIDAVVCKPSAQWFQPVVDWLNDGLDIPSDAFAVTEADLEKLSRRESSAAAAAQQSAVKQLSPLDMLKQKQASAQPSGSLTVGGNTVPLTAEQVTVLAKPQDEQPGDTSPHGTSTAGVGVMRVPVDGPCTPAQVDRVKALLTQLAEAEDVPAGEPTIVDTYRANLDARGIKTADLTVRQCDELIAQLEHNQMQEFFENWDAVAAPAV